MGLSSGERVWVIEARQAASGTWYHVVPERTFIPGWISAGPASDPSVKPFDRLACPAAPNDVLGELEGQPMRSLVCFRHKQVTLVVYWPTPEATGVDVPCPWGEPRWLLCYEYVNQTGDAARSFAVYGTTELPALKRGAWLTLVGHYDDPRSKGCPAALGRPSNDAGEVAASILFCRTRFVADAISPANPP